MGDAGPAVLVAVVVVLGLLGVWAAHRYQVKMRAALDALCTRDGLVRTDTPCGLSAATLAGRFDATPRGSRRTRVLDGVEGPVTLEVDGRSHTIQVSAFTWRYEQRRTDGKGNTSHRWRSTPVTIVRLPRPIPGTIAIRPEGVLGRLGFARGDQQLESDEFNRRFRVEGDDPHLTVTFLDAAMQERFVSRYVGRAVHLEHDLVVLGGDPGHRDPAFPDAIGLLPALAQDAVALLQAAPPSLWRTVWPASDPDVGPPS